MLIEELLIEGLVIAEWGGARSAALFLPHATRKAALSSGLHLEADKLRHKVIDAQTRKQTGKG